MQGCQPPMSLNIKIENWYSTTHDIICAKKKTLVYPNHQEFAMKQTRKKDVRIVTFDLIGLLSTNHINSYFTMAY